MQMNAASFYFFHAVVEINYGECKKLPVELEIYELASGKANDDT